MPTFNQFQNGIAKSKADQNGFDNIINGDVHLELGSFSPQLALTLESIAVDEVCLQAITPSGTIYLFSKTSGKIWKRTLAGTYSSLTANANTAGHAGANYFNGFVYYWTSTKLGKFVAETEASRNDSFGTANRSNFTASAILNLNLFIGDGNQIAKVDVNGTFSTNALDLPLEYNVSALKAEKYDLLIGTYIGAYVHHCRVFLWDTYSDSWTVEDEIPENGVNTFINCDEVTVAQCGDAGKLYYWTGVSMTLFDSELRDEITNFISSSRFGYQVSTVFGSRPLIAVGQYIYSIYRKFNSLNFAVVKEYTATGNAIQSIIVAGTQLVVSHENGIDKIATTYATATIDTPEVIGSSNNVIVDYETYPNGIGIATKLNGGAYIAQTPIIDTINKKVYFNGSLADCVTLQARITLTPSGANVPKIKAISIV